MEVEIVEIPEKNTDAMVTLLHRVMLDALNAAHEAMLFSSADVMSAALHIVIETALESASPEKVRSDVISAVDITIADQLQRVESWH